MRSEEWKNYGVRSMTEANSKRGRSAKRKGANGERELVHELAKYGYETKRGDCFRHESDVMGLPGIHIEVKRVERLNVSAAFNQAVNEANTKADGIPTLFHRRNRECWMVTMRLEDWIKLYGKWIKKR